MEGSFENKEGYLQVKGLKGGGFGPEIEEFSRTADDSALRLEDCRVCNFQISITITNHKPQPKLLHLLQQC